MQNPMILTLKIDERSQQYFNALRKTHFPAHINYLEAHLTLFHVLPAANAEMNAFIEEMASRKPFAMQVNAVKHIGNGVAFAILSRELQDIHLAMQKRFDAYLVSQDRQKLWPHITVQNKVTAFKSLSLCTELQKDFLPFEIEAVGFSSWIYLDGPWQHERDILFSPVGE